MLPFFGGNKFSSIQNRGSKRWSNEAASPVPGSCLRRSEGRHLLDHSLLLKSQQRQHVHHWRWSLVCLSSASSVLALLKTTARGTTEPKVPLYGVVVGDPLFEAVQKLIPEVTAYGVNYPASFEATSRNLGRDDVVKHLTEQSKKCPNVSMVLVFDIPQLTGYCNSKNTSSSATLRALT